jgi:glyoxylase-like metal-dependent hydrolase (beta-lactamase superfamily II)
VTDTTFHLDVEALTPSLWRLPLPVKTLPPYDHTSSYVLVNDAKQAVVVDVGSVEAAEMLIGWLSAYQYNLAGVLLTHIHSDHVVGLGRLLEHTPVPVYVHPLEQDRLRQYHSDEVNVHHLHDGDTLKHGNLHISSIHTPGHSPGHLSFVVRQANQPIVMLAGDMVTGDGAIWVGTPEGDVSAYLQSLSRLQDVSAACVAPSHGAVSWQPQVLLDKARHHKEAREQQVLALLEQPTSRSDLTDQLYSNVPEAMRDFAERSLAAHLSKLLNEGRIHERHGAQRKVLYQRHKLKL